MHGDIGCVILKNNSKRVYYDLYAETYENDPRVTFVRDAERGHTVFTPYYKTPDKSLMTRIV